MWRTRRWARDLPDLVVVGTPFERWSALGKRHSRPAGAAPLQGTARPTVATCTAQLATAQPARHRNTARRDSVRVSTTRHGTAQPVWHRNTARNETERRAEASLGPGRDGTGRYSETQRVSHDAARPSRHRRGPRVSAPHGTPAPGREGRASLGTPSTAQEGTASLAITAHPARRGVASQPGTSRHRRSAFGVRRSARHRSPRRINITHQRQNAPSRERRGVLVYPGVSRW